jgi:hypothetical protein
VPLYFLYNNNVATLHDMVEVIVVGPALAVTDCPSAAGFFGPSIS